MHFSFGIEYVARLRIYTPVGFATAVGSVTLFDLVEASASFVFADAVASTPRLGTFVRRPDAWWKTKDGGRKNAAAYGTIATATIEQ
jgi:hypothetical protein